MNALRRPLWVQLLNNVSILVTTAARHAHDDPALLAVQVVRRLPRTLRDRAAAASLLVTQGRSPSTRAAAAFLADDDAAARRLLEAGPRPPGRVSGRVHDELAAQLGLAPGHGRLAGARAAWNRGDLHAATTLLEQPRHRAERHLLTQLGSQGRLLGAGHRLPAPQHAHVRVDRVIGARGGHEHRPVHLLTNSLPHTQSGYTLRSHAVLRAQRTAGCAPLAVTRVGYPVVVGRVRARARDVVDGIDYERLLPARLAGTPEARLSQSAELLARAALAHRATVLHTTTHFTNALVVEAVARALGLPWVYEVRGQLEKSWLARRPAGEQREAEASERYQLWRSREVELCVAADHVVVLSAAIRDDLVARGVPAERMTLVPNGVDAALLGSAVGPVRARRALGLPAEGFWVGTVSSLVDYEGLDTLLHAVRLLRTRGVDARCALVGDGVSRPSLARLATQLGLDGAVVLPGRVDRAEAVRWHQALDVFCVPRRNTEVCRTVTPLKPVEAMAVGRPVVASDLPALAEVVGEPGGGLLCHAGDAAAWADVLARLSEDPELRDELAQAGRAFAATRTWSALGQRYVDIYTELKAVTGP